MGWQGPQESKTPSAHPSHVSLNIEQGLARVSHGQLQGCGPPLALASQRQRSAKRHHRHRGPYTGSNQGELYKEALGGEAFLISLLRGVTP